MMSIARVYPCIRGISLVRMAQCTALPCSRVQLMSTMEARKEMKPDHLPQIPHMTIVSLKRSRCPHVLFVESIRHRVSRWRRMARTLSRNTPPARTLSSSAIPKKDARKEDKPQSPNKPSPEQLEKVFVGLTESLPRFFVQTHNYHLYSPDVVFEDRIRGIKTIGINSYILNLAYLKIKANLSFAHIKFHVLKATKHEDQSCIKVRWQIVGVPGLRIFFTFWRYNPFKAQKTIENVTSDVWDGFSTFYVNGDGKIYRHLCDKVC